ncbi:MAG: DNA polymerase III subunit delta [Candidatus Westeberhardia cardiocondylae]|nr:DNA polymerase III subunit delta [Candidatus Westeberhardia cardiocondylae]
MVYCLPEDLQKKLRKNFFSCYFLLGNDSLLLLESEQIIFSYAKLLGFERSSKYISLNRKTNWNKIYYLCYSQDLFFSRKIISLILPEDTKEIFFISEKLLQLASFAHSDLLLIIKKYSQLSKIHKNSKWFLTFLRMKTIIVNCMTPLYDNLYNWVLHRSEKMKLFLRSSVCQFLCYYYEGNLLALMQTLNMLALMFPNKELTIQKIKFVTHDLSFFTIYQWVDMLLSGNNIRRVLHVLKKLQLTGCDPVILFRSIQREILLILRIKNDFCNVSIDEIWKKYKIWKIRQKLVLLALNRLDIIQLKELIQLMIKMEVSYKINYYDFIWQDLCYLSFLLCAQKNVL